MSGIDTEELRLYKDPKLYHGSRYKVYQNNKTMEEYLGEPGYKKLVYYKSIDEPITINEFIRDCDEYTYGSITNQGKIYYFFVDQITTDAYKQTVINFTVDWWSTNWNNIQCTKAHVTRKQLKPHYMMQPFSPLSTDINIEEMTDDFVIMATYIPSYEQKTENDELIKSPSYISYVILEGTKENVQKVSQGYWYTELGLPGADIKDCFVVPYFKLEDFTQNEIIPPMFTISIDQYTDHTHEQGFFGGKIMDAFKKKYNCFLDSASLEDPNLFTGNEYLYNTYTGRWLKATYVEWKYPLQPSHWFWEWVETDQHFSDHYYILRYYSI